MPWLDKTKHVRTVYSARAGDKVLVRVEHLAVLYHLLVERDVAHDPTIVRWNDLWDFEVQNTLYHTWHNQASGSIKAAFAPIG